jgi:ABC-2 type transport system permease protein
MKERKKNTPKNTIALRGGSYSLLITAIVLGILVVCNILASAIPATYTKLDISSAKLYSITSNTKAVVNNLEKDVTIYWIVQANEEDDIIENLLAKYDSLSDHIDVVKKNPDVYPTFAAQYTDEDVANNSLVVECGERSRYIAYDDIYLSEVDYSSYSYYYGYSYTYSFDGEGAITSAIDYVVNEDQPKIYTLEGHGEGDLPTTFSDQISKSNIDVDTLSLLTVDEVPEDADIIMIYAPSSDLSEAEITMLSEYAAAGGKILVVAGPASDGTFLTNLYALLSEYGVETAEGIVIEGNRSNYYGYPFMPLPNLEDSDITNPLSEENYYVLMYLAQGLQVSSSATSVTSLLTTTDESFVKAYDELAQGNIEQADDDTAGPFALGVSISCDNDGQIVWFTSSYFLEDEINSYSSGANVNLAMNAISSMVGEREALAIRSKSLDYSYLTIPEATATNLKLLLIGVFPLAYLGIGIAVFVSRRRKQNVTV